MKVAIVEGSGKFLMVRENSNGPMVYNQSAGDIEENETLIEVATEVAVTETHLKKQRGGFRQLLGIYYYSQYNS